MRTRVFPTWLLGVLIVVLVFLIVWLGACTPPPQAGSNPAIVGDSVVAQAQWDGAFSAPLPYAYINADAGRSVHDGGMATHTDGVQAAKEAMSHLTPDGWLVISLGTNSLPKDPVEYEREIRYLDGFLPDTVNLAWVSPYSRNWLDHSRIYRDVLNTVLPTLGRSHFKVIDWYENVKYHDFCCVSGGWLKDGTHPTPEGSAALVALIKQQLGL